MQTEILKTHLIQKILDMKDMTNLQKIDKVINQLNEAQLTQLAKPTLKKLDLEQIKKEQGFRPIDKRRFFAKIEELNIEESVEELIKMI